jgi:hypothetical protein
MPRRSPAVVPRTLKSRVFRKLAMAEDEASEGRTEGPLACLSSGSRYIMRSVRILTLNVIKNRSAASQGNPPWLAAQNPDVLTDYTL